MAEIFWIALVTILFSFAAVIGTFQGIYYGGITGFDNSSQPLWGYVFWSATLGGSCNCLCMMPFLLGLFLGMNLLEMDFDQQSSGLKWKLLIIGLASITSSTFLSPISLVNLISNEGNNIGVIMVVSPMIAGLISLWIGGLVGYQHYLKFPFMTKLSASSGK